MLDDLAAGARLLWRLPAFLRNPVRAHGVRAILQMRLQRREADFLGLAARAIYAVPTNPYRHLLAHIGCAPNDLAALVGREGVEGALRALYRQGVYLTVDEFKGRRPVVRGNLTMTVTPGLLRNPQASVHIPVHSGGSRSPQIAAGIDLEDIRAEAADLRLFLAARGGEAWVHSFWSVPGGAAMRWILRISAAGGVPARWFSQVDPAAPGLHPRYRWSARVMRWGSLLAGTPLPAARHVSPDAPGPIVAWMADTRRRSAVPHLLTYPSAAVRVCRAALDAGVDLSGAQFTVSGEPMTAGRLQEITRAGAAVRPVFAAMECGQIGYGCLNPEVSDDLHLATDLHAVIQAGADGSAAGLPAEALLVTALRPTAPFILLNVSLGDQAALVKRSCGCPLEQVGWGTHLHTVRSYEKVTAGGMTFLDAEITRVLEEVLPARFGGGPTDYQLVEEEAADGSPHLRLLVHPAVGALDEHGVADVFLSALGAGPGAAGVMARLWRDAGVLRVERRPPRLSASGKILHRQRVRTAGP